MGNQTALPQRNYPHLMVLEPTPNRSTLPRPTVFRGVAWAMGIEITIAFLAAIGAALWGMK